MGYLFRTARLTVQRLGSDDTESFFRYRSLPETAQYQTWRPKSLAEAESFIHKNQSAVPHTAGTWLQLAILLSDSRLIGDLGVHFLDEHDQVEIGYTLSPAFQGRGYALEAVRGLIDYSFGTWKKHRITASVDPENIRSIHLLQQAGFRQEARFVGSIKIGGVWKDDMVWAQLYDEWANRKGGH